MTTKTIATIIILILMISFSLYNAFNPRAVWRFNQKMGRWQYKDGIVPEPSDAYVIYTRVFSILFTCFVIAVLIAPLLMNR